MKVVKPQKLSLLTRCFEFSGKQRMGISILMHVPMGDVSDLYSEVSLWKFAGEQLGKDAILDAGVPKLLPEFLVHGSVYAPGGTPVGACAARARVGAREKIVFAFGDRNWDGSKPTDPQPFTAMPLDWTRAYGGPDYPANPLGKGSQPVPHPDGSNRRPLPNFEHPQQRVVRAEDRPEPVSLGPIDQTWPQRAARVGTYDDAWLKSDFPAFARDIDWRFFNLAAPDQWLAFPMPTNETYEFENLHPTLPLISGNLPGFSARCFVNRRADDAIALEKIAMRLSTMWFFPAAERAILVYQGFVDDVEEDGADVRHVVIAAERSDEPKPLDHYRDVLIGRLDKDRAAFNMLRESDLLPAGLAGVDPEIEKVSALMTGEGRLRRNQAKRGVREIEKVRAEVASYGLDPDEHAPALPPPEEPVPTLEHLPEFLERKLAEGTKQRLAAEAEAKRTVEVTAEQFASEGLDFQYVRDEIADKPKGPPTFSAQAQIATLAEMAKQHAGDPLMTEELEQYYKNPEFIARLKNAEQKIRESYALNADRQDAAPEMEPSRARRVHGGAVPALKRGQSFAGLDLTGADLSGLDLSGANFAGAFLECANLSGTRLVGCDLSGAVLARARLQGADLSSTLLIGANLGRVECDNTRFDGADCSRAILRDAHLLRASFRGAQLTGVDCTGTRFEQTDWSEARLDEILFMETSLCGVQFTGAKLPGATFLRCEIAGVNFRGATLDQAVFVGARGAGADFAGAHLHNLRCVESCDFNGADFSDSTLTEANLRGSQLTGAHFLRARLDKADLSEANLHGAWFYQASAIEARFVKSDLREAVLVSCNLMNAVLQRSNIIGADFRLANLFQSDFARVRVDRSVQFDRALRTRMRTLPRLAANKAAGPTP